MRILRDGATLGRPGRGGATRVCGVGGRHGGNHGTRGVGVEEADGGWRWCEWILWHIRGVCALDGGVLVL